MKIKNASVLPRRYFGLHMVEGVAEYKEIVNDGKTEPYRILVSEETIKNMDVTFEGRPVFVHHVDEVKLDNLEHEADGWVIRSFFNKADGKHWAEFMVVTDRGHEAIKNGWKLSNAYEPKEMAAGGTWHGVEYAKEVMSAEYEHLAIVPNPRYQESVILTPDEFKKYNDDKEAELLKFKNSKGAGSMINFFKRSKVENADVAQMSVLLPKSKVEKTITQLVNEADEAEQKKNEAPSEQLANGDHMVEVGGEKMSVNSLVEKYNSMCAEKKNSEQPEGEKQNEESADEKKENEDAADAEAHKEEKQNDESPADEKQNEESADDKKENEEDDKKENEDEEKEPKKQNHLSTLKNAPKSAAAQEPVHTFHNGYVVGKSRYGSN